MNECAEVSPAFRRLTEAIDVNISSVWIIIEGGHCQNEIITVATIRRVALFRAKKRRLQKH